MMSAVLLGLLVASPGLADSLWSLNAQGAFDQVLAIARAQHLAETPDRDLWLALAFAYRSLDSLSQAQALYEALLEANPRDADALLGLALVLSWQDQLDSAIHVYQRVLEIRPGDLDALLGLARTCGWAERWACAQQALAQAQARAPHHAEVFELAGDLALWQDRLAEAARAYRQALDLDPQNLRVQRQLARVLEWQGQYRQALQVYQNLLAQRPHDPEALQGLRTCREHLAWKVHLLWKSTLEDDAGTPGRYHSPQWELLGPDHPRVRWRIKTALLLNQRDTLRNRLFQVIPGLLLWPEGPVTLRAAYAWSPEPAARNWWLALQARLWGIHAGLAWRHELLEPVREVTARTVRTELRWTSTRWHLSASGEWASIPADTNRSQALDLSAHLFFVHTPHTRLALTYAYGTLAYEHWSALYYSPEALRRHSLGLSGFRHLPWGYAYAEASVSLWTAEDSPGVQTFAAELGIHRFYLSLTYFATTQQYHTWTLLAGLRWPLMRIP